MTEKKTTLLSIWNQDWKKSVETEKVNKLLPNIPTSNITKLNVLTYAEPKLVSDKIGVPQRNPNRNTKSGLKIRLEGQVKTPRQQAKVLEKQNEVMICWDEKTKTNQQISLTMQLEDINQKILTKYGKIKRYRDWVNQYKQNRVFPNNKRKFYQQVGGKCTKTYQQPDSKDAKECWSKIWERKERNRKTESLNNMWKELQVHEEAPEAIIYLELPSTTL